MSRNKNLPSGHKLHAVWIQMKQRCYNKKCKDYPDYGGRGITICCEWKDNYMMFFNWALSNGYEEGLCIDRSDNNLGYSPSNCRFVTTLISLGNRRSVVFHEYNGEKMNVTSWAEKLKINRNVLGLRIKKWGVNKALSTPLRKKKPNSKRNLSLELQTV